MFALGQKKEPAAGAEERSARRFRSIVLWRILIFASLTALFLWYSETRLLQLELRLRSAEEHAAHVNRNVLEFSRQLNLLKVRTDAAEQEAAAAKREALEAAAARRESDREAEQARSDAIQAREQIEKMRAAREADLDRMQEALNRVAPTRRTPTGMVIQLGGRSFEFDFDRADLRQGNRELLSRIAGVLLASTGYSLYVYGHTDDVGADEYNQQLSERRAASVRDYLVNCGLPRDLIRIQGFGKSSPLVMEKSAAARERNRRVEIGIVDTSIVYDAAGPGASSAGPR